MKVYDYELSNYSMINSVTKEVIIDEGCNDDAESLIACWLDDFIDQPLIKDETLRLAWESSTRNLDPENTDFLEFIEFMEKFLAEYDNPKWIVYKLTTNGMACGPVSMTAWYVVDKDVQIWEELIIENACEEDCVEEKDPDF